MKRSFSFAALLMTGSFAFAHTIEYSEIINFGEVTVDVNHVFAPKGFDENDHIEIIATGFLPDPCHRRPYGVVEKIGNEIKITVKANRSLDTNRPCLGMAVPYLVAVPVGPVQKGSYKVTVNEATARPLFAQMEISERDPNVKSIDDYLYANVEQVSVDATTRVVSLRGENHTPCLELDFIKSISNESNTYALLPVLKKNENVECTDEPAPFEYKYQLPNDLQASKILVHVRSVNGRSVNKVFAPKN